MWVTSPTSAAHYPPRFHLQMPRCHDQPSCNGRTVSPCFSSNRDKQSAFSGFIKARERPGQENHRQEKTDGDTRTETTPRTKKANETERTKGEEQGIKKNREKTGGGGENTKGQRNFWQGNSYFLSSEQTTDSAKSNAQPKGETKKKRTTQRERERSRKKKKNKNGEGEDLENTKKRQETNVKGDRKSSGQIVTIVFVFSFQLQVSSRFTAFPRFCFLITLELLQACVNNSRMPGNSAQAWSLAWANDQAGPAGSSPACTAGLDPTRPKKKRKRTKPVMIGLGLGLRPNRTNLFWAKDVFCPLCSLLFYFISIFFNI